MPHKRGASDKARGRPYRAFPEAAVVEAWQFVEDWLDAPAAWVPARGRSHREILGCLVRELDVRGNLVTDAVLAALCIEHGVPIVSADPDFARFTEITWLNPLA